MARKKTGKSKQTKQAVMSAPIKWVVPDNLITRFATNMIIQSLEDKEFKISFFEVKPPIILGPSKAPLTEVRAECVASVIITAERMPKFIEALQKHLEKRKDLLKALVVQNPII